MKDSLFIKSRLNEINSTIPSQYTDKIQIHAALQRILFWVYNDGNLRTQKEIEDKITILKEEILGLRYANISGFDIKILEVQINELLQIMQG